LHSLPLFIRLQGRIVILIGDGEAADAKRRLLDRAGAVISDDADAKGAAIAIVAVEDESEAIAIAAQLKARGLLVNVVDRPALCDFTTPAIVDRDPVLIAIGTGGASAGLAKAVRQRIEALLPARLGALAQGLFAARSAMRSRYPDGAERRRALDLAMQPGAVLDPLAGDSADCIPDWLAQDAASPQTRIEHVMLSSADPDDLTLKQARLFGMADMIVHDANVPLAILSRARADAARMLGNAAPADSDGLVLIVQMGQDAAL
jgi:uroporphyrin-III C-methyltransferase / precorrin-2 dehydrogenase / sirohydrochlorin ferrochelatase